MKLITQSSGHLCHALSRSSFFDEIDAGTVAARERVLTLLLPLSSDEQARLAMLRMRDADRLLRDALTRTTRSDLVATLDDYLEDARTAPASLFKSAREKSRMPPDSWKAVMIGATLDDYAFHFSAKGDLASLFGVLFAIERVNLVLSAPAKMPPDHRSPLVLRFAALTNAIANARHDRALIVATTYATYDIAERMLAGLSGMAETLPTRLRPAARLASGTQWRSRSNRFLRLT